MRRLVMIFLGLFIAGTAQAQNPRVIVSVKPLHAIVASVMEGVASPVLLVDGALSEHTHSLKPSDVRAVNNSDLVVLVDEGFETWLRRAVANRKDKSGVLRLLKAPGVSGLPMREGGLWTNHEHGHSHQHNHTSLDGHIWLDPRNGQAMARAVAAALTRIDPPRAATYSANADKVVAEIAALDLSIAADLTAVRDKPFIVFHDAYQYFEARYGLAAAGSITVDPERQPGAKRVSEIRAAVTERRAVCVFSEPQFTPALVVTLVEGTSARTGELDPIGAAVPAGPAAYTTILRNLTASLKTCLTGSS